MHPTSDNVALVEPFVLSLFWVYVPNVITINWHNVTFVSVMQTECFRFAFHSHITQF